MRNLAFGRRRTTFVVYAAQRASRWSRAAGFAIAASVLGSALVGCSDSTGPDESESSTYTLSGQVRVVTRLAGPFGEELGSEILGQPTGILVRLIASHSDGRLLHDEVVDSTMTTEGRYTFRSLSPGEYHVSFGITPADDVATEPIRLSDRDVVAPDTLEIRPVGEVSTYPNPFPASKGLSIEFTTTTEEPVDVDVLGVDGSLVWRYTFTAPPDFYHIHWSCFDTEFNLVPPGPYWLRLRMDGAYHYNYVVKADH